MESNGIPGRIHVSQEFRDEMTRHGLGSWLEERADKVSQTQSLLFSLFCSISHALWSIQIHAKGKGKNTPL